LVAINPEFVIVNCRNKGMPDNSLNRYIILRKSYIIHTFETGMAIHAQMPAWGLNYRLDGWCMLSLLPGK